MDYKEEEITAHLGYIIGEALIEYQLFNLTPKQITYINNKLQGQILDYLREEIPNRISPLLYHKLGLVYDMGYVGTYIGNQIYLYVTNFTIEFNALSKNNNR